MSVVATIIVLCAIAKYRSRQSREQERRQENPVEMTPRPAPRRPEPVAVV